MGQYDNGCFLSLEAYFSEQYLIIDSNYVKLFIFSILQCESR